MANVPGQADLRDLKHNIYLKQIEVTMEAKRNPRQIGTSRMSVQGAVQEFKPAGL